MPQAAVLITYREIFKRKPTSKDLVSLLEPYTRREMVGFLAKLNCLLGTWQNSPDFATDELLSRFLLKNYQKEIQFLRLTGKRILLSRLTLLYLIKNACLCCPNDGLATNSEKAHADVGLCCLIANDLVLPFLPSPDDGTLAKLANILPFTDYIARDQYAMEIGRTQMLFEEVSLAPSLKTRGDFVNLPELFTSTFGISAPEFCELIFACSTRFLNIKPEEAASSPEALLLRPKYFSKTEFPPDKIRQFLNKVSITEDELTTKMKEFRDRPGDDLTIFQQFPLIEVLPEIYLCLDPGFLVDKAGRSAFWSLLSELEPKKRLPLLGLWGAVFEEYTNHILQTSYSADGQFIPAPHFPNGDEAFDACILEDTTLVVMEHKSSTLRADVKYSGDVGKLKKELNIKFIEGDEEGRKGIAQLSRNIQRFVDGDSIANISSSRIHKIVPTLICLDSSVTVPYVGRYFADEFKERFDRKRARKIITPVFTLGISDVENLLGYLGILRISDILESYYRSDTRMFSSLTSSDIPLLRSNKPEANSLRARFSDFGRSVEKRFFGETAEKQEQPLKTQEGPSA